MSKTSKFAFDLGARVNMPTMPVGILTDGFSWPDHPLQGIVSGRKQMIGRPNKYDIHILQPDLTLAHIVADEQNLIDSQPVAGSKPAKSKRRR